LISSKNALRCRQPAKLLVAPPRDTLSSSTAVQRRTIAQPRPPRATLTRVGVVATIDLSSISRFARPCSHVRPALRTLNQLCARPRSTSRAARLDFCVSLAPPVELARG